MTPNHDRKPALLLFNPFVYIAGAQALFLGWAAILAAGLLGAMRHTHFDGVLDVHSGATVPLWVFLSEGMIDWLCLAGVLLIIGRIASKTSFRSIDVLGTQALARWPTLFVSLVTLPSGFQRFGNYLVERLQNPGAKPEFNTTDAAVFCAAVLAIIVITCWVVVLMYKAYSVSCNLTGGKAIGTFIGGLILSEIVSKVAVWGLLSFAAPSTAHLDQRPAAAPKAVADTAARAAAQAWLSLIDEGSYSRSWNEAAPIFQTKVTEKSWGNALESFRKPLGSLVSRKLKTAQPATQLPGAPDGQYIVLQFDASFAEKKAAVETVTVGLEKDGTWRASGYYIK
jgi:hypothetical protein